MKKASNNQLDNFPKLANPARRALSGVGIQKLEDLTNFSEKEFSKLHGIGPNAVRSLKEALSQKGLSFKE